MEEQNIQSKEPVEVNETTETPVKEETVKTSSSAPVKAAKAGGSKLSGKTIGIICGAVAAVAIIVVCLVLFMGDSVEKLMEKGTNAFNSGQTQEAKEYFEKASEKGNTDANYYLGVICENAGDMPNAASNYEKAANAGNTTAAEKLGFMLYEGNGVTQNKEKARANFEKALEAGDEHSDEFYYDLGMLCYEGVGGSTDYAAAKSYFEKAEIRGNAKASYMLGTYYEDGDKRVNRDISKAIEYYDRSARGGNIYAAERLGYIYSEDEEVEPDFAKAAEYFAQAAEGGSTYIYGNLGILLFKGGNGLDKDVEFAKECFKRAIDSGYGWDYIYACLADCYMELEDYENALSTANELLAMSEADDIYKASGYLNLGELYQNGKAVKKDYSKAMEYYQLADNLGNINAKAYIGDLYYYGYGVEKNLEQARNYIETAIANGCNKGFAYHRIGFMYYSGNPVAKDYETAKNYFEKAYKDGYAPGTYMLGYLYYKGLGVKVNLKKAAGYFEKAAAKNNGSAMTLLGYMYQYGEHYDIDLAKAVDYYQKAEALGIAQAMYYLGACYDKGEGVTQDYKKAAEYYQKGIEKNNNISCIGALGILYYDGNGVEENNDMAFDYMNKALDAGLEWSSIYWRIGTLYLEKESSRYNRNVGINYLEKALNAGDTSSHLFNSYGIVKYDNGSYTEAAQYFAKAIDSAIIEDNIKIYRNGLANLASSLVCLKKYPEAAQYYAKALDNGHEDPNGEIKGILKKMIQYGYISSSTYSKYTK